jgi:hypothetical protein
MAGVGRSVSGVAAPNRRSEPRAGGLMVATAWSCAS